MQYFGAWFFFCRARAAAVLPRVIFLSGTNDVQVLCFCKDGTPTPCYEKQNRANQQPITNCTVNTHASHQHREQRTPDAQSASRSGKDKPSPCTSEKDRHNWRIHCCLSSSQSSSASGTNSKAAASSPLKVNAGARSASAALTPGEEDTVAAVVASKAGGLVATSRTAAQGPLATFFSGVQGEGLSLPARGCCFARVVTPNPYSTYHPAH